jgi:hypothetical protein
MSFTGRSDGCLVNVRCPGAFRVRILDLRGCVLATYTGHQAASYHVDRSTLASGFWFVQLVASDGTLSRALPPQF